MVGCEFAGNDGQTDKHARKQNPAPRRTQPHARRGLPDAAPQTGTPAHPSGCLCAHANADAPQQSLALGSPPPPGPCVTLGCGGNPQPPPARDLAASRHARLPWAAFNSTSRALRNVAAVASLRRPVNVTTPGLSGAGDLAGCRSLPRLGGCRRMTLLSPAPHRGAGKSPVSWEKPVHDPEGCSPRSGWEAAFCTGFLSSTCPSRGGSPALQGLQPYSALRAGGQTWDPILLPTSGLP